MYKKPGYFCRKPFDYLEIQANHPDYPDSSTIQYICCPNWNDTVIGSSTNLYENWHSDKAKDIRENMLQGNFKNCSTEQCPTLNTFIATGRTGLSIYPIEEFEKQIGNYEVPKVIRIANDYACNLQCPSCRLEFIPNSKANTDKVNELFDSIEAYFANKVETLSVSGAGDPFYSTPIRNFLFNFDPEVYPSFKSIQIVTNGTMLTPKTWNKMKNIQKFVSSIEISIDAANKDTYEKEVRLRGNWDKLMENLKFIATLTTVPVIRLSFVSQKANYTQMEDFIQMGRKIFKEQRQNRTLRFIFYKIADWAKHAEHGFDDRKIWHTSHPQHNLFRKEVEKLNSYESVIHNFHEN